MAILEQTAKAIVIYSSVGELSWNKTGGVPVRRRDVLVDSDCKQNIRVNAWKNNKPKNAIWLKHPQKLGFNIPILHWNWP